MADQTAAAGAADGVEIERRGAAGLITLSRSEKRNALTIAARARIAQSLPDFARDPLVYAVVVRSATEGMFCAGGDIVEMTRLADRDMEAAEKALGDEIALVWTAECFTKPTVSLINGPVIGGGNCISRYGTHRVAGERYRFAMPEVTLGFLPNNGLTHAFARMPKDVGMYLALTGEAIGAADAYHLGLVTHCIPATEFDAITAALADADPVDPVLDSRHRDPGPSDLMALSDVITRCFGAGTVAEIVARLERERGDHAAWAHATREKLRDSSPSALVVTHRLVREASAMDLRALLELEHALVCRMLDLPDLHAGVRARLVEKGAVPSWRPALIEDISVAAIEAIFSAPEAHHVRLPARQKMQESMV